MNLNRKVISQFLTTLYLFFPTTIKVLTYGDNFLLTDADIMNENTNILIF